MEKTAFKMNNEASLLILKMTHICRRKTTQFEDAKREKSKSRTLLRYETHRFFFWIRKIFFKQAITINQAI